MIGIRPIVFATIIVSAVIDVMIIEFTHFSFSILTGHYAEYSGYWETTTFLSEIDKSKPMHFYDSNTGKLLFTAPIGRSWEDFLAESRHHGWPSFRDQEVNWNFVRVLPDGETVSVDGTHLGHDIPDNKGRRYCINLVSVAGNGNESSGRRDL